MVIRTCAALLGIVPLAIVMSGCARPAAVRQVATASQPVVLQIQRSGAALQQRFALQREAFDARAATEVRLAAAAKAEAVAIERSWRLGSREKEAKQIVILREGDAALRENPTGLLPATAPSPGAEKLDLSALKTSLTALETLKGAKRMTGRQVFNFARDVNDELAKLKGQSSAAAPAAAPSPDQP